MCRTMTSVVRGVVFRPVLLDPITRVPLEDHMCDYLDLNPRWEVH